MQRPIFEDERSYIIPLLDIWVPKDLRYLLIDFIMPSKYFSRMQGTAHNVKNMIKDNINIVVPIAYIEFPWNIWFDAKNVVHVRKTMEVLSHSYGGTSFIKRPITTCESVHNCGYKTPPKEIIFSFYEEGDDKYYKYQKTHNIIRYVCFGCECICMIEIFKIQELNNRMLISIDSQFSWNYLYMVLW